MTLSMKYAKVSYTQEIVFSTNLNYSYFESRKSIESLIFQKEF